MKYFIRKRKDCISSFCCKGERKKNWRRGIKKNIFFEDYCMCVWRMEGKCEDWVLVLKGGGKNVENVDVVSKVMEKKFGRSGIIADRNLKRYLLNWYPRNIKCRLFRSVKHKLNLTDFCFNTGKIPLFQ